MIHGRAKRFFKIGPPKARKHFEKGDPVTFPDNQFADLEKVGLVERGDAPSPELVSRAALAAAARAKEAAPAPRRRRPTKRKAATAA